MKRRIFISLPFVASPVITLSAQAVAQDFYPERIREVDLDGRSQEIIKALSGVWRHCPTVEGTWNGGRCHHLARAAFRECFRRAYLEDKRISMNGLRSSMSLQSLHSHALEGSQKTNFAFGTESGNFLMTIPGYDPRSSPEHQHALVRDWHSMVEGIVLDSLLVLPRSHPSLGGIMGQEQDFAAATWPDGRRWHSQKVLKQWKADYMASA